MLEFFLMVDALKKFIMLARTTLNSLLFLSLYFCISYTSVVLVVAVPVRPF